MEFRRRNPRVSKPRDVKVVTDPDSSDRRSKTLAKDRETILTIAKEGANIPGFNKVLVKDYNDGYERVEGTISYRIIGSKRKYLNVILPPLENLKTGQPYPKERYYLFSKTDYPSEARNFTNSALKKTLEV